MENKNTSLKFYNYPHFVESQNDTYSDLLSFSSGEESGISSSILEDDTNILYREYASNNIILEDIKRTVPEIKSQIRDTVKRLTDYEPRIENKIVEDIYNKHYGYWFLQKYLNNSDVFDVIIYSWQDIRVSSIEDNKVKNEMLPPSETFPSKKEYEIFVNRLTKRLGIVVNSSNRDVIVDDRTHKVRVSINKTGETPNIALRSHAELHTKEYIFKAGMLPEETFNFLRNELINKKTMVIAGEVGSGKTTLCRSLLFDIDDVEYPILSIEPFKELYLRELGKRCVYEFDAKGKNLRGSTLDELNASSLTYKHSVFFFAEIRERSDVRPFIEKSNTGLGGLTTMHSETAEGCYKNLLAKADTVVGEKTESVEKSVKTAVNYYVVLDKFRVKSIKKVMPTGEFKEIYALNNKITVQSR